MAFAEPTSEHSGAAAVDLVRKALRVAKEPRYASRVCILLLAIDLALSISIVRFISYTEIDWKAYMQQVQQYLAGERDYTKIYGDTGPLVYPAGHVYIYRMLYGLTDGGRDIGLAQYIFNGLYLAILAVVMDTYVKAKAPPYVYPLLILSKRLHSIFLLRLFNDGFAVFFLFLAIACYQRRWWMAGSLSYSAGVSVKMSLVLALPAIAIILWQGVGRDRALGQAMVMGQLQLLLGYPFLAASPWSYLSRAFEFSRQFLFKWTVNWRFVGEDRFLSVGFSRSLLIVHVVLLGFFVTTKWLHAPIPESLKQLIHPPASKVRVMIARRVTPDFVLTSIISAMMIGCLCARSLHYQFYAYIAWSTPYLLWRGGLHPVLIYAVWAAEEWAWNVYPSTVMSSMVVVGCLTITCVAAWLGTQDAQAADSTVSSRKRYD